jgi:hypothetical protein
VDYSRDDAIPGTEVDRLAGAGQEVNIQHRVLVAAAVDDQLRQQ